MGVAILLAGLLSGVQPQPAAVEAPDRRGQMFILTVDRGDETLVYAAYHATQREPEKLVVQRSRDLQEREGRMEASATRCPGLRAVVDALERTPWPAIRLDPAERSFRDRERFTGYSFNGMIGYTDATSWESRLFVMDVHGEPRTPFAAWAHELVRTVDACLPAPAADGD